MTTGNRESLEIEGDAPDRTRRRHWLKPVGAALVVAVIAEAIALVRYQVWRRSFTVPLNAAGTDQIYMAQLVRSIHDTGWYFTNPHIGAPFGQQLYDFPQTGESIQVLVLRFLSLFSARPYVVVNMYYLIGFATLAFVTYLVLDHLGFRFLIAAPISVLYTWLPYHIMHGEFHLFRSTYLSTPIAVLVLFWTLSWRERFLVDSNGPLWGLRRLSANLRWKRVAVAVVFCMFIASYETMVTAFILTTMAVAALLTAFRHREANRLVPALVAIVIMGGTFGLLFLPNLAYKTAHGPNHSAASRLPTEQVTYGLQISKMVLPLGQHHISAFRRTTDKAYRDSLVPGEAGQTLGILGTLGLIALLYGALAVGLKRWNGGDPYERSRLWSQSSLMTLILILFGTMSGFALVMSTLGLSQIRVWDRVVVVIAFFALLMVAIALEHILPIVEGKVGQTFGRRGPSKFAGLGAVVVLMLAVSVFSLWDTDTGEAAGHTNASDNAQAVTLARLGGAMQQRIGAGGMIFQLPVIPFPETPPVNKMQDYDELLPYLFSSDLRFSYGATRGRPNADWQLKVNNTDPVAFLPGIRGLGFDGILVDTFGYSDGGTAILAQLTDALGPPVVTSPDQRWKFWDLRNFADRAGLTPAQLRTAATQLVGRTLMAGLKGPHS